MPVFVSKDFQKNPIPRPDHDIIVEKKNSEWIGLNAKYFYGQYISGQCGITIEDAHRIEKLRSYVNGRQDTSQYKKSWFNEYKNRRVNEYGHINFEAVYSPMPKIVDKIVGMFLRQQHNCVARCTSEFTSEYILKKKKREYANIKTRDLQNFIASIVGINPDEDPLNNPEYGYALKDVEELDIVTSTGTTKIPYELAGEKIIDHTQQISNYKHLKRNAVVDELLGFVALREVIDQDKTVWENVDITDVIIEYSKDKHFNNSRYCGIQEWWTVEDLRKKGFKEEELKKIAKSYHEYNLNRRGETKQNRAFNFYDVHYPESNSYGYDDYVIPVLYVAFKSNDITYYNDVKAKDGNNRLYRGDFGELKENTVVSSESMIYEGRWILGTDIVFDDGTMAYVPRDKTTGVRLPIHIAKLEGMSIVERAIPILDEFAMLGYKFQHSLARAQGKQPIFDVSTLENIAKETGGKLKFTEIVDMYFQGAGVPYRSKVLEDIPQASMPRPIEELEGGIGSFLNELIVLKDMYSKELVDVTGISPIEAPDQNTAVGIAQMAVANMSDILKPLYDIYLEVKEKLSYNTVYRTQLLIFYNEQAAKYYTNVLGKHDVELLKMMNKNEPIDLGITFEAAPSEEMKQHVIAWADRATQGGKNGVPILTGSEFLFIIKNINSHSGLTQARMMLTKREKDDQILANERQKAAIEAQAQANEQLAETQGKIDMTKQAAKGEQDRETQREKYALENEKAIEQEGAKTLGKMVGDTMGAAMNEEQQQQQI